LTTTGESVTYMYRLPLVRIVIVMPDSTNSPERPAGRQTDLDTDDVTDSHVGAGAQPSAPRSGATPEDVDEAVAAQEPPHDAHVDQPHSADPAEREAQRLDEALVDAGGEIVGRTDDHEDIEGPNPA